MRSKAAALRGPERPDRAAGRHRLILPLPDHLSSRLISLALHTLAQQLAVAADRLSLLAGAAFGGFLVIAPELHFPEHPFALHLLFESSQSLIDVVVANEDLHG